MSPTVLPTAPRQQQGLRGRHVLWVFLGFFATVFVVNGAMIYSAVSTYSGLVANEPYRKGLHYNERIAAAERQANLGWTDTLQVGRDGQVRMLLSDADGRAGARHAGCRRAGASFHQSARRRCSWPRAARDTTRRASRRWRRATGSSRSISARTRPRTRSTARGGAYG